MTTLGNCQRRSIVGHLVWVHAAELIVLVSVSFPAVGTDRVSPTGWLTGWVYVAWKVALMNQLAVCFFLFFSLLHRCLPTCSKFWVAREGKLCPCACVQLLAAGKRYGGYWFPRVYVGVSLPPLAPVCHTGDLHYLLTLVAAGAATTAALFVFVSNSKQYLHHLLAADSTRNGTARGTRRMTWQCWVITRWPKSSGVKKVFCCGWSFFTVPLEPFFARLFSCCVN